MTIRTDNGFNDERYLRSRMGDERYEAAQTRRAEHDRVVADEIRKLNEGTPWATV